MRVFRMEKALSLIRIQALTWPHPSLLFIPPGQAGLGWE